MATHSLQAMAGIRHASEAQRPQTLSTMLTRVALRNFKGHADLQLDLGRITVLIGPTSSGKSTVLQALNLLASILQTDSLDMLGNSQEYGRFADIVTDRDESRIVGVGVGGSQKIRTSTSGDIAADFSYDVSFGASDGRVHRDKVRATVDAKQDPPPHEDGVRIEHESGKGTADAVIVSGPWNTSESPVSVRAGGGLTPSVDTGLPNSPMGDSFSEAFGGRRFFESLLAGLWYVPFSRVVTSITLPLKYAGDILSPDRALGAATLLSRISADPPIQKKISGMMQEIGFRQIVTRNVPSPKNEGAALALDFVGDGVHNSIVHEGSGLNQLVNMLAMLAYSPKGSVITIEEPELHLDPAAQARLVGILVRHATEEDKQIIFTTHSDHLLYPLLAHIEKKDYPLGCGDVAMHYFSTDESGRPKGAERLEINEHGQIYGGLRGFWNADGHAMGEILGWYHEEES